MGNVSVVINYEGHNPGDAPGYVQLTRSAGRVYLVVDGRPVGNVAAEEFAAAAVKLGEAGAAPRSLFDRLPGVELGDEARAELRRHLADHHRLPMTDDVIWRADADLVALHASLDAEAAAAYEATRAAELADAADHATAARRAEATAAELASADPARWCRTCRQRGYASAHCAAVGTPAARAEADAPEPSVKMGGPR